MSPLSCRPWAYLDEVHLERPRYAGPFVVWTFVGQGHDQGLRLAPGTDIVVRDIHYIQYERQRRPVRAAFVDRVTIDTDRSAWPRDPGFCRRTARWHPPVTPSLPRAAKSCPCACESCCRF
ncbi:MAG TPA: hypothetical protein VK762_07965 [Polyangiaceae bacterium]|nr:hypothetical protein [Polyangiaceae bacterium]